MKKFLMAAVACGFLQMTCMQVIEITKPCKLIENPHRERIENRAIVEFMVQNYNGLENAALYVPETNKVVGIGKNATAKSVEHDIDFVLNKAKDYFLLTGSHLHGMTINDFVNIFVKEKKDKKAIAALDRSLINRRMLREVPTDIDIHHMLEQDIKVYNTNPDTNYRHKILVYAKGQKPRVIEYSLNIEEQAVDIFVNVC